MHHISRSTTFLYALGPQVGQVQSVKPSLKQVEVLCEVRPAALTWNSLNWEPLCFT